MTETTEARVAKTADGYIWGTGRRKSAVARVRVRSGSGRITVNDRELNEFFPTELTQLSVTGPLLVTNTREKYDVAASEKGGLFMSRGQPTRS